ncbi:MAG: thioredoxin family protein [Saprospiraceae bacterium]
MRAYINKGLLIATVSMVILLSSSNIEANDGSIIFSNEKVDEALRKASEEGKLVFMDFYASWCTPCKWMEQTTFTDTRVVTSLNKDFISIKVDIDDIEGFQMKNRYEVNFLPTILILNSKGKMVERIEQTMVADDLIGILNLHNSPENKIIIKHDFNKSPKRINKSEIIEDDPWAISRNDYRRYTDMEEKRNYRVQVGIYEDYSKAQKKVNELRETFMEPIVVLNDFRNEKVLFKIMLGQFDTMSEANSFCKILISNFGIEAIVN